MVRALFEYADPEFQTPTPHKGGLWLHMPVTQQQRWRGWGVVCCGVWEVGGGSRELAGQPSQNNELLFWFTGRPCLKEIRQRMTEEAT